MNKINKLNGLLLLIVIMTSCRDDKVEPVYYTSITGYVTDASNNLPLSGVGITTNPGTGSVLTNEEGVFYLSNVPTGTYNVIAKKDGYKTGSASISVLQDKSNSISILLSRSDDNMNIKLPYDPIPSEGEEEVALSGILAWRSPELPDESVLSYDVLLYDQENATSKVLVTEITDTSVDIDNLRFETTYFWQVNTRLSNGNTLPGEVWSFTSLSFPDNRFLYTSGREGNFEIYSSDSSGNLNTRLTANSNRDLFPLWSPNRDIIAYSSDKGVQPFIYTMDADGSNSKKISPLPVAGYHNDGIGFCWSPDGGKFLFSNYEKLYSIDRNGTNMVLISTAPSGRHYRKADWTAQGNRIVVEAMGSVIYENEIYIMNSNGSGRIRLIGDRPGIVNSPSFSINGNYILFTQDVSGFESMDGRQLNAHIFLMNITDTADVTDLSLNKTDGTNDLNPRFSPDGSKIIFVNASNDGTGDKDVWITDVDGNNRKKLFSDAEMPHWK